MHIRIGKHLIWAFVYGAIGAFIGVVALYLYQLERQPLQPWHTAVLDEEFHVGEADRIQGPDDYTRLEERLFEQLRETAYSHTSDYQSTRSKRFVRGSLADPLSFPVNWNRTFEMPVEKPVAGVLLLHGFSDSPYSSKWLAESLYQRGFWVLGLRLPGHGTAPSGLSRFNWKELVAATHMAGRYLKRQLGEERPLFLTGYSEGAALAMEYSLAALKNADLPAADALVFISPRIGDAAEETAVDRRGRLTNLPGFASLAWKRILPEFDPYRYNSAPLNADVQRYKLNQIVVRRLNEWRSGAKPAKFPPVMAFQSVADTTASSQRFVDDVLNKLGPGGHEYVLFDVNQHAEIEPLLPPRVTQLAQRLLATSRLSFGATVVTNRSPETNQVVARSKPAASERIYEEVLGMTWPQDVYALSHISLPFPAEDPVYGASSASHDQRLTLGNLEARGEPGVLPLSPQHLSTLRYNPFFPYLEHRVLRLLSGMAER